MARVPLGSSFSPFDNQSSANPDTLQSLQQVSSQNPDTLQSLQQVSSQNPSTPSESSEQTPIVSTVNQDENEELHESTNSSEFHLDSTYQVPNSYEKSRSNKSEVGKRERSAYVRREKELLVRSFWSLRMRPLTMISRKRMIAEVIHAAVYGDEHIEATYPEIVMDIRAHTCRVGTFGYRKLKSVVDLVYNPFCKNYLQEYVNTMNDASIFPVCERNDWSCSPISVTWHTPLRWEDTHPCSYWW